MESGFMEILLIRHGESESKEQAPRKGNQPDTALSALGKEQAALLAQRLADSGIQRIYTSDLARALETAEILNEVLCVPVEVRPELREIDMGRLFFCGWEDIRREDPDFHDRWHRHEEDLPYPGGECGADMRARTMLVLLDIVESGFDKVAVVTHGGVIRSLVCAALGIGQEKRFLIGPPENTSVTVLRVDRATQVFTVYSVNDAGHLR